MRKILSLSLAFTLTFIFTACSKDTSKKDNSKSELISQSDNLSENEVLLDSEDIITNESEDKEEEQHNKNQSLETEIQSTKPSKKPSSSSNSQTSDTPDMKPQQPEEQTPEAKPVSTIAHTLLSDFKSMLKANDSLNAKEIADRLLSNPIIEFSPATSPVEEGYLSGFDNAEIKGFKSGVMFAPMIGSIPFIGYIFETTDSASATTLAKTLQDSANLRWNLCVEAEEMVCETLGNKVFFVMSPKSFE